MPPVLGVLRVAGYKMCRTSRNSWGNHRYRSQFVSRVAADDSTRVGCTSTSTCTSSDKCVCVCASTTYTKNLPQIHQAVQTTFTLAIPSCSLVITTSCLPSGPSSLWLRSSPPLPPSPPPPLPPPKSSPPLAPFHDQSRPSLSSAEPWRHRPSPRSKSKIPSSSWTAMR